MARRGEPRRRRTAPAALSRSATLSTAAPSPSMSSSKGSSWGIGSVAAAVLVPTLVATVTAAWYAYRQEQAAAAANPKATQTGRKKKAATAAAASAAAAKAKPVHFTLPAADPLDDASLTRALHHDIGLRSSSAGRADRALEARIWRNLRRLAGDAQALAAFRPTTRTEIGQWIVAYHANVTPAQVLAANGGGSTSALEAAALHSAQRAADYEVAWQAFDSVEVELAALASPQPEQVEMRKDTELAMLDLAHKMRNSGRLVALYDRVRARADAADPSGYSEMEFFTLWMVSPLVGRWNDFVAWADFMKSKGQSLDEFHHLAIQRADLTDFKQMYSMRKAASEEGLEWVQPSADQLEWGVWDIVGTAWSLVESTGSDAESSELFQKGKEPLGEWKKVTPGVLVLRKMGANARISSMVSPQLPVVGPLLQPQREFTCAGSVLFRDHKHGLCRLNERYADFTRVEDEEEVKKVIAEYLHKEKAVEVTTAAAEPAVADVAAEPAAAEAAEPVKPSETEEVKAAAEPVEAAVEAATEPAAEPAAEPATEPVAAAEPEAAAADAAAASADAEATPAAAASSDAESSSAAAAVSDSAAPVAAVAASASPSTAELSLADYDPADPPQVWRGTYVFEQVKVDEDAPHAPQGQPFLRVEYKAVLKIQKSKVHALML